MDFVLGFTDVCWLGRTCKVDWTAVGDLATWLAAIATLGVGLLALITSNRSVKIADQARNTAEQHLREVQRERDETARITSRLIASEITALPTLCYRALVYLMEAIDWKNRTIKSGESFALAIDACRAKFLPSSERVIEKIHTFQGSLGADLATLIGGFWALNEIAEEMFKKAGKTPLQRVTYAGPDIHFDTLYLHLDSLARRSIDYSKEFRVSIGLPPNEYTTVLKFLDKAAMERGA